MKFNITSYTLFSFVMVLFFPSLIFAPWTKDNPPLEAPGVKKTCPEWIEFNGFTLDNYPENIKRTKRRNVWYDKKATTFAAMYAFHIGGLEAPDEILPEEFCFKFETMISVYSILNLEDEILPAEFSSKCNTEKSVYSFTKLEEEYKTCQGWILLYGFKEYDNVASTSRQMTSYVDTSYNNDYARNQNPDKMKATSLFVYSYYEYFTRRTDQPLFKPSKFCEGLGLDAYTYKPFVNTYVPELTCQAWIELYGFNDNVKYNASIISNIVLDKKAKTYKIMHDLPLVYAEHLQKIKPSKDDKEDDKEDDNENHWEKFTPLKFCKRHVTDDETKTFTFYYTYSKPSTSSHGFA